MKTWTFLPSHIQHLVAGHSVTGGEKFNSFKRFLNFSNVVFLNSSENVQINVIKMLLERLFLAKERKICLAAGSQWCQSLLSIGGIICNFTSILPCFQHWGGMNLDHDFFQVSKLSEDQKKVFIKNRTLFYPNSGEDQKRKGLHQR